MLGSLHFKGGVALLATLAVSHAPAAVASAATNNIYGVTGTGTAGSAGDAGPATAAQLTNPASVISTPDGGYLIGDTGNHRVRRVTPGGTITTLAGNGTNGAAGDGGPATAAQLSSPHAIALTADGGVLIADTGNHRIRRVSPGGIITTVAGAGTNGFSGDGGAATAAQLSSPQGVASTADGGFLIGDSSNNRVRRVTPGGIIATVAGTGTGGFSGDGGPATAAKLMLPGALVATPDDGSYRTSSARGLVGSRRRYPSFWRVVRWAWTVDQSSRHSASSSRTDKLRPQRFRTRSTRASANKATLSMPGSVASVLKGLGQARRCNSPIAASNGSMSSAK